MSCIELLAGATPEVNLNQCTFHNPNPLNILNQVAYSGIEIDGLRSITRSSKRVQGSHNIENVYIKNTQNLHLSRTTVVSNKYIRSQNEGQNGWLSRSIEQQHIFGLSYKQLKPQS